MATDIRHVKKYATKLNEKIELERQLKSVNAELEKLEAPVLKYFQHHGVDRISAEGRTLYLRRDIFASKQSDRTTEEVCAQLRKMGLDAYTGERVAYQSVSAYVREQEEEGFEIKEIEEKFGGVIRIAEVYKVGSLSR